MAEKPNPLDEAGAVPTLDPFFAREPDDLNDEELAELVAAMRAKREEHDAKELAKEDKPKAKRKPAAKAKTQEAA